MEEKWIADSGDVCEEEIKELVGGFFEGKYWYLASCTDAYCSGRDSIADFLNVKSSSLLELRVFTEEKELFVSRTLIGDSFSWRITDDDNLTVGDYIDSSQFIDINHEKSFTNGKGMKIESTVGGEYELPIESGENVVFIRSYVSYDKNCMAKVADFRVRRFGRREV